MTKKCPKCGYEKAPSDIAPDYECPKCGVVYAKVEAALLRENDRKTKNTTPKQRDNVQHADSIRSDIGFSEQFKRAPLWQKIFISSIFVLGGISIAYNYLIPMTKQINYDLTYKQTENLNGVQFYYFKSNNAPLLEPINNFSDLNDTHLSKILSVIPISPKLSLSRPFRKDGKYIYSIDLSKGGSISIYIHECNKNTDTYYCIEKVIYSPNEKEMARIKARKMPNKYVFVSEEEYGVNWPYKFKFGLLTCKRYRDVVIISNHKVYAVNGKAMGAKRSTGEKIYEDAWNVRKPFYGSGRMSSPAGFIPKGLALCRK
ncbi:MAG: hypothetical protein ABW168_01145 [Sedimenticola sp.]